MFELIFTLFTLFWSLLAITADPYNRMLCRSGLPGTENPLLCPHSYPMLASGDGQWSVVRETPQMVLWRDVTTHQLTPKTSYPLMTINGRVHHRRRRPPLQENERDHYHHDNRRKPRMMASDRREKPQKKIYLIPLKKEKNSLINYILVPEEVLEPNSEVNGEWDDEAEGQSEGQSEGQKEKTFLSITAFKQYNSFE